MGFISFGRFIGYSNVSDYVSCSFSPAQCAKVCVMLIVVKFACRCQAVEPVLAVSCNGAMLTFHLLLLPVLVLTASRLQLCLPLHNKQTVNNLKRIYLTSLQKPRHLVWVGMLQPQTERVFISLVHQRSLVILLIVFCLL